MADFTLSDVLEDVYQSEFSRFDDLSALPDPHPPLGYKLRMSGIFRRFNRKVNKLYAPKLRFNRRMLLVYLAIILLALTACAAAKIIGDFLYEKYEDNTELFALNVEGAPTTIENIYDLAEIPEGYECTSRILLDDLYAVIYTENSTGNTILLHQSVKSQYDRHINTEGYYFEYIEINNHNALYIDFSNNKVTTGGVIWDTGDYILDLYCDMTKNEIIELACNIKISQIIT